MSLFSAENLTKLSQKCVDKMREQNERERSVLERNGMFDDEARERYNHRNEECNKGQRNINRAYERMDNYRR